MHSLALPSGERFKYHSLAALEEAGLGRIARLPVSLRIVLESLVRHCDGVRVTEAHVRALARWQPKAERTEEIPFLVARIIAPEASGIPLLADLAAMRGAAERAGLAPEAIEPLVPVDLIVDHSLQVDHWGSADALRLNTVLEMRRNAERYQFLKWAVGAFKSFKVIPPGVGIIHQVNLEHLARGVRQQGELLFPDTLVGVDSHTTMANGIGVLGWGVGGIEAEAAMLGQPVYFLTPDVIGVHLIGKPAPGVTSTDVALTLVERLRGAKVTGKFVEFLGAGVAALPAADRATVANMAPEYGATVAFFPTDDETLRYFRTVGRTSAEVERLEAYCKAQGLFGTPRARDIDYTDVIEFDLGKVVPCVAGPRRPQDRIALDGLKERFHALLAAPTADGGFGKPAAAKAREPGTLADGDVVLAAITSCANTSNPGVLLAAGLLAKKAVERGLQAKPYVKTSLTPGSRVVTEYLVQTGLQDALDRLGFHVAGYGCATCIGNSGPLPEEVEKALVEQKIIAASVLSGNRNFEARIHPHIKANFLASPPLVVAFAIAGRVDIDFEREPLGRDGQGHPVYLRDLWPSAAEIAALMPTATAAGTFRRIYDGLSEGNPMWDAIPVADGALFRWASASSYIKEPPFFSGFSAQPRPFEAIRGARCLVILGDSVTTDHISPGGGIGPDTAAGLYLQSLGIKVPDFNTYIGRRGNHEVMMRGTFANVRIRNLMLPGSEGGVTLLQPEGISMSVYEAAQQYQARKVPLIVLAGEDYGTGSSRDWGAKGPQLLGVRAVIAKSFERIHRSNLIGMGILPCEFGAGESASSLGLDGTESYDIAGFDGPIAPRQPLELVIRRKDGSIARARLRARVDTEVEAQYLQHGGILPYVLRQFMQR